QDTEGCWDPGAASPPGGSAEPDGDEEPDTEPGPPPDTPKPGQTPAGDTGGLCQGAAPPWMSPRPSPGPPTEEGSSTSSDDDMGGLRRRQGHETHPGTPRPGTPPPMPTPPRGTPGSGDEDGLSVSKYLLGALALVAVGLLAISGERGGPQWGSAPQSRPQPPHPSPPQDSQQQPPPPEPPSLQSVSQLLDKLAKENQEIRHMQAQLQAHKDELQALLRKSDGEAAAATAE
ncbi:PBIP1 protein, partial [Syrrhaptes paradoxus]|nr:PBIP1 protein [Syrrhaptes paradoxus]